MLTPDKQPPPGLVRRLHQAAELRAQGLKWEAVAEAVGKPAETIRRWPRRYPRTWADHLRRAERAHLAECAAEARTVLRGLLRSSAESRKYQAATFLARLYEDVAARVDQVEQPAEPDEFDRPIDLLDSLPEADVEARTDACVEAYLRDKKERLALTHQADPA